MSGNNEILESLKRLSKALAATIADAESNDNILFFQDSIKQSALHIYEQAQLLNVVGKISPKPPVEIKIIKAEEPLIIKEPEIVKPIPVINIPVTRHEEVVSVLEEKQPEPVKEVVEEILPVSKINAIPPKQITTDSDVEEDDATVNGKIAKFKQPVLNLADKLKDTPIKELVKAISISKKFEFINELFAGNSEVYKSSIEKIESAGSFDNAAAYLEKEIADKYGWDENDQLAAEFFMLVKRRYL